MAYTTINKSTDYFNTKLYTGNGSTNAITGVGFQPDMTWLKIRTQSYSHRIYDAVRGVTKYVHPDTTEAEYTTATSLTAFNSDGFTLGSNAGDNKSGDTFASWNWKANGQGSSNTDGSINTTYTSANTTAGISIIKYNGNGSANATIGHGLGVKPDYLIIKKLNGTENWVVQNSARGFNKYLYLDTNNTEGTHSGDFVASVSSTLITLGTNGGVNNGSGEYICYAFVNKTGFFKSGQYTGNGNVNGTFVYTGFKPAFIIVKKTNASEDWEMFDNKRLGYNVDNNNFVPNSNSAEATSDRLDIVSNGFKFRASSGSVNASGDTYIYMTFAEAPLVGTNNIPCTAR